ncbi:MAG: EpsI family protein, partial [Halioglobus sp.]|nr:EpsI family protein [Halioglobus sp.]
WLLSAEPALDWVPVSRVGGMQRAEYVRDGSSPVAVALQYDDGMLEGAEVIGSSRVFVPADGPWRVMASGQVELQLGAGNVVADEARLRGPGGELFAWSWYIMGSTLTTNDYLAKFHQAAASLGLAPRGIARVVVYSPRLGEDDPVQERLRHFVSAHGETLVADVRRAATTP